MWLIELADGLCNGSNTTFTTRADYATGSVVYWLNGIAQTKDDPVTGWLEVGGRSISLVTAPQVGDVVQFGYRPI